MPIKTLKKKHILLFLPLAFLLILTVAGAGGYLWLRTSLPDLSGTVTVSGIGQDVEVIYDANGIPHIRAATTRDAYFALGYIHAGDRMFQMDFMRRLAAGRLSEVVGKATYGLDATMRTLGLNRLAEESFRRMPERARSALDAYAAGVNAWLETRAGAPPPEFVALRYEPESWKPSDSLLWGRLMALRLAGNWRTEALRAALATRLSPDQIEDLWPTEEDPPPPTVSATAFDVRFAGLLQAVPDYLRQISASNSWAIAGSLTTSGKPLLANDPHLGYQAPGLWYLAQISAPGLEIAGATVAGVPFHILGRTDRFAWGFTTTESDTQDLFVERLTKGQEDSYDTPAGPRRFEQRTETIRIKGADPVDLIVRSTRHGPVISDLDKRIGGSLANDQVVALSAMALRPDDMTPLAILDMNRARNWDEFRKALRDFHAPQQNISFADTDGNIAFFAPARVPVRAAGDGSVPVPGWSGEYDWTGEIPFEQLPQSFNPASGRIVSANHRIVSKDYPWYLTRDWADPYRARRIYDRLESDGKQTPEKMASLQTDIHSGSAKDLLPLLLGLLKPSGYLDNAAAETLREWDHEMAREATAPLIYMAWLAEVNRGLYADELGPLFDDYFGLHPRVVERMLQDRTSWCDDISTPEAETCSEIVTAAMERALGDLKRRYGADMAGWKWGEAHHALFRHPVLGRIPVIRRIADIRIEAPGGFDTVDRAQNRPDDRSAPFAAVHGPGYRAIYDLADLANSRFSIATGESGNPLSPRYDNLTEPWRDGLYIAIPTDRTAAMENAMGVLKLVPEPPKP